MKARAHIVISGFVQGVLFRYGTRVEAQRLDVVGWVRNLWDGGVEVLAEGEKEAVEKLIKWCHHGPPGAMVKRVDVDWEKFTGEYSNFFIK